MHQQLLRLLAVLSAAIVHINSAHLKHHEAAFDALELLLTP